MEQVTVIKVGGAIVEDAERLAQLLDRFAALPGQKVLEIGAGEVMVKSLKDGNGYLTGLKVQKVYLDDCWIDGLL